MAKTDNLQTNYYATNILLCPRLLVPGECLRISGGKPGRHHVFWGHTARRGRRVGFQAGSFWPHEGVCFFFNQSATPGSNPLGAVPGCLASGECSSTHSCLRPCRCQRWLLKSSCNSCCHGCASVLQSSASAMSVATHTPSKEGVTTYLLVYIKQPGIEAWAWRNE